MTQEKKKNTRVENRLLYYEDCAGAIDQLFQSALTKKEPDAFSKFLEFARTFDNLSVYNSMLVRIQRPGATMVGTRDQWLEIERQVLPDAVPIIILWPFGPVRFVFELADTKGKELPGREDNPLFAKGELPEKVYVRIKNAAEKYAIEIAETKDYGTDLAGTAAGFNVCPEKISGNQERAFRVKLNANHDLASRFATLTHELGHIYCGHLGRDSKGRWPNRRNKLSKEARELEAEAVAWLVCQRNGITTRSREYLNTLINDTVLQKVSMYTIYEAANRVESRTVPK
ncbi:ImmA/IrrE family metallo-endopeptidase [bacterium]|nr:ImmA/IrrE family metallo-endopeptidase [bacterium]